MESLSVLSTSRNSEALHDLRLDAKKAKAIEFLTDGQNHYTQPLKAVVQEAGNTRAAELNLQTLSQFGYRNPALEQELNAVVENGYETLKQRCETYKADIIHLSAEWEQELTSIKKKRILSFFIALVEAVGNAFRWHVLENDLHENRKKIKNLLYAFRFLPARLKEVVKLDEQYLDDLQEQIGNWHDLQMALELLEGRGLTTDLIYAAIKKEREKIHEKIIMEVKLFSKKVPLYKPGPGLIL